ncbi:MAG TPA: YihY/virulence factor BrkB family protein [Dermatophilaceae bacterium]|nr:YihY/virulence factor BrkB family protein [Dermatophilaceae bacterium]
MTGTAATEPATEPDPDTPDEEQARPNIIDRISDRLDEVQRRIAPVAVIHGVLKKYGEDRGGQLAMLLTYRGFFAVFPLLLAFVNVLGILLQDNDELRQDLIDSTLSNVPIIGDQILKGAAVSGSIPVVVGSVLVSIWAGLGLLEMLQEALNTAWGVPLYDRPPWIIRRLKALPAAVLMGACLLLSGSRTWLFSGLPDALGIIAGVLLPVVAGSLCYLGLHSILCHRKVPFTAQLPGALFVGLSWYLLQSLGEWYVNRFIVRSSDTYGVFVIVFGILSWSYLLASLYLYGNELSSVLYEKRWPRSLTGRNLTDADQSAFARVSEREVRVRGTDISIDVPRQPAPGP